MIAAMRRGWGAWCAWLALRLRTRCAASVLVMIGLGQHGRGKQCQDRGGNQQVAHMIFLKMDNAITGPLTLGSL
jgi:hypothetical protein